jgi:hypothetical protein
MDENGRNKIHKYLRLVGYWIVFAVIFYPASIILGLHYIPTILYYLLLIAVPLILAFLMNRFRLKLKKFSILRVIIALLFIASVLFIYFGFLAVASIKEQNPQLYDVGVFGKVTLGPTCPVVKEGEESSCEEKSYKTKIEIKYESRDRVQTIKTDEQGNYRVKLWPEDGLYYIRALGREPFPRCDSKEAIVEAGKWTEVNISCDTGIRTPQGP